MTDTPLDAEPPAYAARPRVRLVDQETHTSLGTGVEQNRGIGMGTIVDGEGDAAARPDDSPTGLRMAQ